MAGHHPVHLSMWSGSRNISTAMMRSWGSRPDTFVCDEAFYAYYLQVTGRVHPGAEEVIASGETDWRKVVESLTGFRRLPRRESEPVPDRFRDVYEKAREAYEQLYRHRLH